MAKRKKKSKGKSRKGLNGAETAASRQKPGFAATGRELSKPLIIVGGLLLGNLVGKGIDKFITVDESATGFQVKKLVKPLIQSGLGVGVILVAKDKANEKEGMKMLKEVARGLGYGIAGAGIISGVKLMKADLFEGLGDTGDPEKKPVEARYYREAKGHIMQLLKDNSFRPSLPEPASDTESPAEDVPGDEAENTAGLSEDVQIL